MKKLRSNEDCSGIVWIAKNGQYDTSVRDELSSSYWFWVKARTKKKLPITSIKPLRTNLAACADETLLYNNVYTFLPCKDLLRQ
jgi:hypothetical protein